MDLTIQKGTGNDILVEVTPSETQFVVIDRGIQGATGATGAAATIAVGATTTLAAGSPATVSNTGTSAAAVFDFGIPQGIQGIQGIQGATGTAATIAIGTTSTIAAGSPATVTNVGTSAAAVFDFGIPQGAAGTGDVTGAASSTDNAVARYDGTTGKIIQNSTVTIADDGATVIDANSTSAGLRITQIGAGNALLVEDSANPDSSPFVVQNDGRTLLGSPTSYSGVFNAAFLQAHAVGGNGAIDGFRYTADAFGVDVGFLKSRSATTGTQTIVQSGDSLGVLRFAGSDGTSFKQAATIEGAVDGTPGVNDMPGRLVFSTTADGASSPTERMRIGANGNIGIGVANSASAIVWVNKSNTGATTTYGLLQSGSVLSDVTVAGNGFLNQLNTLPTTFTLLDYRHFAAAQGTIGAGSAVTNQYGFYVFNSLTGATNNYGFFSNIAAGTSRTITFVERTTNVVTITTSVAHGFTAGQLVTVAATTNTGVNGNFVIASAPTTTTFTYAQTGTDIVLVADTGSTVVVGRFNFYAAGTADNYFSGNTGIGTASLVGGWKLEVAPAAAGAALRLRGGSGGTSITQFTDAAASAQWGTLTATSASINLMHNAILTFTTNTVERLRIASTGVITLGGVVGSESLRVTPVASSVNYVNAFGGATGNAPVLFAQGSDTNISLTYATTGTGAHLFNTGGNAQNQFRIVHTASAVNYLQVTGNATTGAPTLSAQGTDANVSVLLLSKGIGGHVLSTGNGANIQLVVANTTSAVNYLQVTGAATGGQVQITSNGTDTNVAIGYATRGAGQHFFYSNATPQFNIANTASSVNYLRVAGAVTTGAPAISAQGSDANIDLALTPKGTGAVRFGTLTANADAPITGYIEIKDSAGTVRKLAVIA